MPYFRHRRRSSRYQSLFQPGSADAPRTDEDGDRIYTEEDYAVQDHSDFPDEAFLPDEEVDGDYYAVPPTQEFPVLPDDAFLPDEEAADPFPHTDDSFRFPLMHQEEDELLMEEMLTDEERAELRRSRWRLISGLTDFAGVIFGTAAILLLVMVLVSLINWLSADLYQTFTLWQTRL